MFTRITSYSASQGDRNTGLKKTTYGTRASKVEQRQQRLYDLCGRTVNPAVFFLRSRFGAASQPGLPICRRTGIMRRGRLGNVGDSGAGTAGSGIRVGRALPGDRVAADRLASRRRRPCTDLGIGDGAAVGSPRSEAARLRRDEITVAGDYSVAGRPSGGTGRRSGLKIPCPVTGVRVRIPPRLFFIHLASVVFPSAVVK